MEITKASETWRCKRVLCHGSRQQTGDPSTHWCVHMHVLCPYLSSQQHWSRNIFVIQDALFETDSHRHCPSLCYQAV